MHEFVYAYVAGVEQECSIALSISSNNSEGVDELSVSYRVSVLNIVSFDMLYHIGDS